MRCRVLRWAAMQPRRTRAQSAVSFRNRRAPAYRLRPSAAAALHWADLLSLLLHIYNIFFPLRWGSLAAPRLLPLDAQPATSFCPLGILRCFLGSLDFIEVTILFRQRSLPASCSKRVHILNIFWSISCESPYAGALLLQADQMAYKSKMAAIWCCMTNDYVEGCCCMCCWS